MLGQGFPGAALLLSLSALLASVLDVDASAAPTRSPPQTFPVARSKSEWRGPGMETKRTLQPSSESTPSFPCPGIQAVPWSETGILGNFWGHIKGAK